MTMDVYENLKKLNIQLPTITAPKYIYELCKRSGNHLYISGQGPIINGDVMYKGKLGKEITIEEGKKAAELCVLNCLSIVENSIGDLNKIKSVVKLLGFVSSAPSFNDQPEVINGASQLLIDILGDRGRHARSAIGVNELPLNIAVEIEMIVEIEE